MTVGITVPVTEKLVVIVIGSMVPAGEAVVLLPKDSKLSAVLLPAAILGLAAWLTAPVAVLAQIGLMVPAEEEVVLLPKDSKPALVLLPAVILALNAWLTAHVPTLFPPLTCALILPQSTKANSQLFSGLLLIQPVVVGQEVCRAQKQLPAVEELILLLLRLTQ